MNTQQTDIDFGLVLMLVLLIGAIATLMVAVA